MRETLTAEQVEALTAEIKQAITTMRAAKLLSPKVIMQHRAKNNAILRAEAEKLHRLGYEVGDTMATRKLLIWNVYLENELESRSGISSAQRYNRPRL